MKKDKQWFQDVLNPYGPPRPLDRMMMCMIYMATGELPNRKTLEKLAEEAGLNPDIVDELEMKDEEHEIRN